MEPTGRKWRAVISLVIAGLTVIGRPTGFRAEESRSDGQTREISTGVFVGMLLRSLAANIDSTCADGPLLPTARCAAPRTVPLSSLQVMLIESRLGLIPISPYWDAEIEAKWNGQVDTPRVVFRDVKIDQDVPTAEQVLESIPKRSPVDELFVSESKQNVTIVSEILENSLSEKRFYPQVGPARLRKRHFKCTVQYDRVRQYSWPVEFTTAETVRDVVYCDRDLLILDDAP